MFVFIVCGHLKTRLSLFHIYSNWKCLHPSLLSSYLPFKFNQFVGFRMARQSLVEIFHALKMSLQRAVGMDGPVFQTTCASSPHLSHMVLASLNMREVAALINLGVVPVVLISAFLRPMPTRRLLRWG